MLNAMMIPVRNGMQQNELTFVAYTFRFWFFFFVRPQTLISLATIVHSYIRSIVCWCLFFSVVFLWNRFTNNVKCLSVHKISHMNFKGDIVPRIECIQAKTTFIHIFLPHWNLIGNKWIESICMFCFLCVYLCLCVCG